MLEHLILLARVPNVGYFLAVVGLAAGVVIAIRLGAGTQDKKRIHRYLRARGCQPITIRWQPFGRGFWGEKNDRIYSVVYRDRDGNHRRAWCKTNLWGGVYLSEDDVQPVSPGKFVMPPEKQLQIENEKLRSEIERLKSER